MASFDDGRGSALYAGGDFFTAGGAPASNIARWDGIAWSPLGEGVDGSIHALTTFDDGSGPALFVGGAFQTAGDLPAQGVAKWNGDSWSAVAIGIDGIVYAFAYFDNGHGPALYAGVDTDHFGDAPASYVAKLDGGSWSLVGDRFGGERGVRTLAVFDHGDGPYLYAGGYFERVGDVDARGIAKWDGGSWAAVGGSLEPGPRGYDLIEAMILYDGGDGPRLVVAGNFESIGGVSAEGMARWDGATWAPMQGSRGAGLDGGLLDLTPGDDGSGPGLFGGGRFTRSGGRALNYIGKWNGTSWVPLGLGMNNQVNDIAFFDDGSGPALFAVGAFTVAGGQPANRVAKWNGSTWEHLGDGLAASHGGTIFAVAGVPAGPAFGLYAGGRVDSSASRVARWNGTAWEAVGRETNSSVNTLVSFDDGAGPQLYAGGNFRRAGGVNVYGVSRWDGGSWSPVGAGFSDIVNSLVVLDEGTGPALYACWRRGISKWNGVQWIPIGFTGTGYRPVYGAAIFDDGGGSALVASGYFFAINDVPARHIAKWNGSTWSPIENIENTLNSAVYALTAFDDGSGPALFASGEFISAGDTVSRQFAKFQGLPQIAGDVDCDADTDQNDFAKLAMCLHGPGMGLLESSCKYADSDQDGDVDLFDIALFQNSWTDY